MTTLRELIFANFENFGQFRENFFCEKSKIDQFAKINSREVSTFPSFAKINSVLKFAKNAFFLAILNHQILSGKNSSTQRVQRINQVQIFFFHAILYTVYLISYNCLICFFAFILFLLVLFLASKQKPDVFALNRFLFWY